MLHPIFGHNYCTLAEMVRTKTCRELYQYGRGVSAELLRENGEGQERAQLVNKKKKRNMRFCKHLRLWRFTEPPPSSSRTWSHHHRKIQSKLEGQANSRYHYTPCLHPGKSCDSSCPCVAARNFCEKYCYCR